MLAKFGDLVASRPSVLAFGVPSGLVSPPSACSVPSTGVCSEPVLGVSVVGVTSGVDTSEPVPPESEVVAPPEMCIRDRLLKLFGD